MNTITVQLTQEDIALGERLSCSLCPIALALDRQFPEASICVGTSCADIGVKRYNLDSAGQKFIEDFDCRNPVQPGRFTLTLAG